MSPDLKEIEIGTSLGSAPTAYRQPRSNSSSIQQIRD